MSLGVGSKNENSKPRQDAVRARPRPPPAEYTEYIGVGEHDEDVSDREVHVIAFPRENASKERLRKAEERSQHIKYIHLIHLIRNRKTSAVSTTDGSLKLNLLRIAQAHSVHLRVYTDCK